MKRSGSSKIVIDFAVWAWYTEFIQTTVFDFGEVTGCQQV